MDLLWFLCGAAAGAAAAWARARRAGERNEPDAGQAPEEPETGAEPPGRDYLRQYRNFLLYDGSERGQEPIEHKA